MKRQTTYLISLKIILAITAVAAVNGLWARSGGVRFKHIAQDQGLSQNSVFAIMQDSKGFMWFGTQDGLNRYDGYSFKIFRPEPGNPGGLNDNDISCLCEDREGVIWIGTPGSGINRFDRRTGTFSRYRHRPGDPTSVDSDNITRILEDSRGNLWVGTVMGLNRLDRKTGGFVRTGFRPHDPDGLSGPGITEIFEDRAGVLWVGTARSGLNRYNAERGNFTTFRADFRNPRALTSDFINVIYEDFGGTFWVGTDFGLNVMNRETGTFDRYLSLPGDAASLSHSRVQAIGEDVSGILWVGTLEGLNQFDRRSGRFRQFRYDPHNRSGISHDNIIGIFRSKSGILWMGTPGAGVIVLDRYGNRFDSYMGDPNNPMELSHNMVYSFSQASGGIIWIATQGGGLNRFDPAAGNFTVYKNDPTTRNSLVSNYLYCVLADPEGIVWIGTMDRGVNRFDPAANAFSIYQYHPENPYSISSNNIRAMIPGRSGHLWLGTLGGGLNRMNPKTGRCDRYPLHIKGDSGDLRGNAIRALHQDRDGFIWTGTAGGGLFRFDPNTGTFIRFFNKIEDPATLTLDHIGSIYEDSAGNLWVGTLGGGLNRLDRNTGKFTHFRENHGLPNDVVYHILEDEQGLLWLSTNKGISRFDPKTGVFRNYCAEDGMPGNEFNGGSGFKSTDGRMYFGGVRGFTAFYPSLIRNNPFIPPVTITDFKLFNRPVEIGPASPLTEHISLAEEIVLTHRQNIFSFEFAALNYSIPRKNRYAYMLEGFDEDWVNAGSDKRFAYYTNLDPGTYVFHVRGSNNDGAWNDEGASITVVVKPPYWKTWWFRLSGLILIVLLSVYVYKSRTRELSQRTRLQTELKTARAAQMSIMPQNDPMLPGFDISGICVPANEVGGDFFDYIWLNEEKTKFGIAIGDVSGKAMKAAMTAVMSSGILFSKADESESIREIMTRINRPLYLKTDRTMFTAMCLLSLDTGSKQLTFTNAGLHNPLLKSGETLTSIKGDGSRFPLGLLKDIVYLEKQTGLNTGDVVVLFTDGVLDNQNSSGEFYGLRSLEALLGRLDTGTLSAWEIKEAIIADASRFAGDEPQQDDMAVVVVKTL